MTSTTTSRRWGRLLTAAAVTVLIAAGCSGTDSSTKTDKVTGDSVAATSGASPYTITVQPEDQGRSLLDAFAGAKVSVDIVVYEINAPQINAALADAVKRGVNVRLVVNGQWWGAGAYKLSFAYQVQSVLQQAAASPGAGKVAVNWSNNNFQITHQKTAVIDALDKDGKPLPASALPAGAQAHILTGNLNAFGYQVPTGGTGTTAKNSCQDPCNFWSARDFYVKVTDPAIVAEVARVFESDYSCAGPTVTNDLASTALPLTWSNGSTGVNPGDPANQYPAQGNYPYFPNTNAGPTAPDPGPGTDQGNVRKRQLDIINNAQSDLRVYNEEMADNQIVNALSAAATRLGPGKVRVVMTQNSSYTWAFSQLVRAGAEVHLFNTNPGTLYIHGKVIMADGKTAYIGSTNISSPSMNYNRELGIVLTDQAATLSPVIATFDADWANPAGAPFQPSPGTSTTTSTTPTPSTPSYAANTPPPDPKSSSFTPPMACGPIGTAPPS